MLLELVCSRVVTMKIGHQSPCQYRDGGEGSQSLVYGAITKSGSEYEFVVAWTKFVYLRDLVCLQSTPYAVHHV